MAIWRNKANDFGAMALKKGQVLAAKGWLMVEVPLVDVTRASGGPHTEPLNFFEVSKRNDLGIAIMKDWCVTNAQKEWAYVPSCKFYFESERDAVVFKLMWVG